jgi:signal transduction histidine kinase
MSPPLGHPGQVRVTRALRARGRLGLRARATVAAALGALAATTLLSVATYGLVRSYLVTQRDQVVARQAFTNARVVRDVLRTPDPPLGELLSTLRSDAGSFPLVRYKDRWYGTSVGKSEDILPLSLQQELEQGHSARQRFDLDGSPHQAVGVAIPSAQADYVVVFPMDYVLRTLNVLRNSLVVGTLVAAAGGAALGYWSSRRVMQPVARVADAAVALAHGGLDTRLPSEHDPDLGRLVTSFNEMADAIQGRIEREARFASDVSHELRTPLTALTAAAEVLDRRRDDLPDRSVQALDILLSQLRRFSTLSLDLLEMSRIEAGVADVNLEPVQLPDLVRRMASSLSAASVLVTCSPPVSHATALVDKRRLERLLGNLLDNACRYGDGPTAVRIDGDEETVLVHVDDDGPGIPPSERQRIFERFARGSTSQHVPGTGLGLALVTEHARLMGGTVSVGESPEGGARFTLALPRMAPAA